jgi:hypothetical protein
VVQVDQLLVVFDTVQGIFDGNRPVDGRDHDEHLTLPASEPVRMLRVVLLDRVVDLLGVRAETRQFGVLAHFAVLGVVHDRLGDNVFDAHFHLIFKFGQPLFDLPIVLVRVDWVLDGNFLAFATDDLINCFSHVLVIWHGSLFEGDLVDAFKAFLEMLLNLARLLRVTQDFDEVFIWQEEEAGEELALVFEVVV